MSMKLVMLVVVPAMLASSLFAQQWYRSESIDAWHERSQFNGWHVQDQPDGEHDQDRSHADHGQDQPHGWHGQAQRRHARAEPAERADSPQQVERAEYNVHTETRQAAMADPAEEMIAETRPADTIVREERRVYAGGDDHRVDVEVPPFVDVHVSPWSVDVDVFDGDRRHGYDDDFEADIEKLKVYLHDTRDDWEVVVRYEVEIEHAPRGERFDLIVDVYDADVGGSPARITLPLARVVEIDDDEVEYGDTQSVRIERDFVRNPHRLAAHAMVVSQGGGPVLDRRDTRVRFR